MVRYRIIADFDTDDPELARSLATAFRIVLKNPCHGYEAIVSLQEIIRCKPGPSVSKSKRTIASKPA